MAFTLALVKKRERLPQATFDLAAERSEAMRKRAQNNEPV